MRIDRRRRRSSIAAAATIVLAAFGACIADVVPNQTTLPRCEDVKASCGDDGSEDCCSAGAVPGGTFQMVNNPMFIASVGEFELDRFEVTVGRFRRFVESYPANKPTSGRGAHPRIKGSGWDPAWDERLPADREALLEALACDPNFKTWTDEEGTNEGLPINCVSWYLAFAFCAWDEGRLPTEAEWNFAAAGGDDQRPYPWGDAGPDPSRAVYDCTGGTAKECILRVGSRPDGDGRWGQADLAGNLAEWNLDFHATLSEPCDECANIDGGGSFTPGEPVTAREVRGGDFVHNASQMATDSRLAFEPEDAQTFIGFRCARDP